MADLKKENFDLKLRIYHLQNAMNLGLDGKELLKVVSSNDTNVSFLQLIMLLSCI